MAKFITQVFLIIEADTSEGAHKKADRIMSAAENQRSPDFDWTFSSTFAGEDHGWHYTMPVKVDDDVDCDSDLVTIYATAQAETDDAARDPENSGN